MDNARKRNEAASDDYPIYSRLFVVCGRNITEEDLREPFSQYGQIDDFYFPRDFNTGETKGIAFIKFSKTSEAAKAVEALHLKPIPNFNKPLKVMVAAARNEVQTEENSSKYKRLFIHVVKSATEEEIKDHFNKFGNVDSVSLVRDRDTQESKGFAYIYYKTFSDAAIAFENCEKKFRAIFAQPKNTNRRTETSFQSNINSLAVAPKHTQNSLMSQMNVQPEGYTRVFISCSPYVTNYNIRNLFDIIPGMTDCRYSVDLIQNYGKGVITYSNQVSAAYAVKKMNQFEYPPGQQIFVEPDYSRNHRKETPDIPNALHKLQNVMSVAKNSSSPDLAQLAEAIAEASKLIKAATSGVTDEDNDLNYCSVPLPPTKPLADIDSKVAKRCFLVCKPHPPSIKVLRDIFCRFGDLINVYTLPNKTVGYARYASTTAADEAIKLLHGAEVCGVRIKVIEAEDEDKAVKRRRYDD